MNIKPLEDYLSNQSIEETIAILDEIMYLLVLKTDFIGLDENLVHQYLTIRGLRDVFIKMDKQPES